jgi:hypothetical protein
MVPLLLTTGGAIAPPALGGTITYCIEDYPGLENGYTVSGNITTDDTGNGLNIRPTIHSWNVTVSLNGVPQFNWNSSDRLSDVMGTVDITNTTITTGTAGDFLEFYTTGNNLNTPHIHWGNDPEDGYYASSGQGNLWQSGWDKTKTIAALCPEPSTATLASLGTLGVLAFIAHSRSRRRREQQRQGAA